MRSSTNRKACQSARWSCRRLAGILRLFCSLICSADDRPSQSPASRQRRSRRSPNGFLTVDELAGRGPLGRSSLYAEVRAGRLRAHQWRGRLVVAEADLAEWLAVRPLDRADGRAPEVSTDA